MLKGKLLKVTGFTGLSPVKVNLPAADEDDVHLLKLGYHWLRVYKLGGMFSTLSHTHRGIYCIEWFHEVGGLAAVYGDHFGMSPRKQT